MRAQLFTRVFRSDTSFQRKNLRFVPAQGLLRDGHLVAMSCPYPFNARLVAAALHWHSRARDSFVAVTACCLFVVVPLFSRFFAISALHAVVWAIPWFGPTVHRSCLRPSGFRVERSLLLSCPWCQGVCYSFALIVRPFQLTSFMPISLVCFALRGIVQRNFSPVLSTPFRRFSRRAFRAAVLRRRTPALLSLFACFLLLSVLALRLKVL